MASSNGETEMGKFKRGVWNGGSSEKILEVENGTGNWKLEKGVGTGNRKVKIRRLEIRRLEIEH